MLFTTRRILLHTVSRLKSSIKPKHDAAYWDKVTAGFDFSEADQIPPATFNRVLWKGLMGNKPYPALRGEADETKDDRR
jgi:hypothetical protein